MKNNLRICFGLSQTLVDIEEVGFDFSLRLRPGVGDLLQVLKQQGHTLILWTSKKRNSFNMIKRKANELFDLFDETYCKEDFELVENIPGCSYHMFKNVKKINADCLIESKESYKKYSNILQMGQKYHIIDKYREFLLVEPTKWMIKMVGEGIVEKREKRRQDKELWILDVFEFIENLNRVKPEITKDNIVF